MIHRISVATKTITSGHSPSEKGGEVERYDMMVVNTSMSENLHSDLIKVVDRSLRDGTDEKRVSRSCPHAEDARREKEEG